MTHRRLIRILVLGALTALTALQTNLVALIPGRLLDSMLQNNQAGARRVEQGDAPHNFKKQFELTRSI